MRLTRLEIYGFKSFAKRTEIVFPQNVTGIVGPNGSGKSNIGDAVRWVLGEQSAKMLRGNSMADVIFNGTEKRKPLNYCEVTLVFDNTDHQLQAPFDEVSITRRVYRSGDSEYLMNGSNCRLKDIVDLFRDTGVGKEGYSIIGQGRIDEILSQKSEDRRGVFEEAAGIVKYRTRKEESEKRLSNMRDNLSRVEDIIAELESQLEPLEKASETARRYLNLRDELRVLECSAFVLRSDRAKERIAEAEQLLTGLKEAIASEEKRADALSEQREKANEGAQKLENEVTAAHDAVLELTRETEAREGELGVLRAEINRMEKDVLALGQEEDVKRARSAALDEEIAKNERDALANRTKIIGLTRELGQKEEALQNAQEEARQAEEKLEADITSDLMAEIPQLELGPTHRGHIRPHRILGVTEQDKKLYERQMADLKGYSHRLQKLIREALADIQQGSILHHRIIGNRLEIKNAYRPDQKFYASKKLPQDYPSMAVSVLVDMSGSMQGARMNSAMRAAMLLYDFATGLGIPVMVAGHNTQTRGCAEYYVFSRFDAIGKQDAFRLAKLSTGGCNRDGAAIAASVGLLAKRPEEVKLMFVISDGQPNDGNYSGSSARADIQNIVKSARRNGIEVFAAAIGNDKEHIQAIYGDGFLDITDLSKFPKMLTGMVKKRILRNI